MTSSTSQKRGGSRSEDHMRVKVALAVVVMAACVVAGLVFQGDLKTSAKKEIPTTGLGIARSRLFRPTQKTSTIQEWSFLSRVPSGWSILTKTVPTSGGVLVGTTDTVGYQLISPAAFAKAGRYRLSATLRVLSGGIALGVLDAGGQHFLVNRVIEPRNGEVHTVDLPFSIAAPQAVFVVMSNSTRGVRSGWMLRHVSLLREVAGR